MRDLSPILEKLAAAQEQFFRAADLVPTEKWQMRPSPAEWSAAEIVSHLISVERNIVSAADRISQKTPKPISFLQRFHWPVRMIEYRAVRRKTPIPLDETLVGTKEEMLADLRGARERSRAFLEETQKRNLSEYRWKHPFLGMLNPYEWFEMIAAHQIRHTKQLKEIVQSLPKDVGITQKL